MRQLSPIFVAFLLGCSSKDAADGGGASPTEGGGGAGGSLQGGGAATAGAGGQGGTGGGTTKLRFAVIGDYGFDASPVGQESKVAELVASWEPDFVVTLGDNNYPYGEASTIDENIGKYFQAFIGNYKGDYGDGSTENRFWPTLGNHDWETPGAEPYLDYFTLPGNERYYEVDFGLVHLFAIDSDPNEPDGTTSTSKQGQWFKSASGASKACYKLAAFHHAPYSSGYHGSSTWMQWPFAERGMTAVLSGHDHHYERLTVDGIPYFVNGLGGSERYPMNDPLPDSEKTYNLRYGAMLVEATTEKITFEFYSVTPKLVDHFEVAGNCATL